MSNNILVRVQADIKDLNQKLDASAKKLDSWSKESMGGFTALAKSIGVATLRFAAMTAPITATGAAIFAMMQKTANTGEELLRMKQKTGMTVEELYNLKQVAEFSDVGMSELSLTLKNLSVNIFEARNKAGDAREIFRALDIDTSRPLNQVLMDLAKRFAEMEDGEGKLALVTQLFGRNAQDIIPVLNDLASDTHKVAGSFSEEAAKAASEFNDNITELKQNITSLTHTMANVLIPVVNDFLKPHPKSGTLEDIDEQIKRTKELISLREKWANPDAVRDMLNELAKLDDKRAFIAGLFEDEGASAKKPAPTIIPFDEKKWLEDQAKFEKEVGDALRNEAKFLEESRERQLKQIEKLNSARESAIQLQLKEIDLAEQEFRISKSGAVQERVRLYEELKRIQEEYIIGLDKATDPASWYAQANAINQTREALVGLNLELKRQTGTFFEGTQQGFSQWTHDAKTSFQQGEQIAGDTAQAIQDFFTSISFDAMQGKLKTLGDYFRSFLGSMQQSVSNILGQLLTQLIGMGISSLFPTAPSLNPFAPVNTPLFHSGGYIPRFHFGGLNSDERLIVGQTEEFMMQRPAVKKYGREFMESVNNGTYSSRRNGGKASNNYFIIDPEAAEAYSKMSERQIEARITKLMKDNRLKQIRR